MRLESESIPGTAVEPPPLLVPVDDEENGLAGLDGELDQRPVLKTVEGSAPVSLGNCSLQILYLYFIPLLSWTAGKE